MSDSDSSSDVIEKGCHLQINLWRTLEKKWRKTTALWKYFIELDDTHVKVEREVLTDLVIYTRSLRHILSCEECEKKLLSTEYPLKLVRHRSEQKK